MKSSARTTYIFLFGLTLWIFLFSLLLEYGFGLAPCSLCLLDRYLMAILAGLFAIALLHNPTPIGQIFYAIITFTLSFLGILLTARHIWIMHLPPDQVPACTPGLNYLMETLPILEVLLVTLRGSGECAQNVGMFLGIPLPEWTLGVFILLTLACLLPLIQKAHKRKT